MINLINAVVFLPTVLILAGLCAYGSLWLCALLFGFGGSPAQGLKVGKNIKEKVFKKGAK